MNIKVEDPQAASRLFDALRTRTKGGELVKVTRGDAVALTGMASDKADPALKSLAKTYRSHLAVTDEGELVYAFDPSFERRDKVPLAERLRVAGQAAWKGFSFFFKIWIVVTLVAYVVAFIAMMIGLTVMGRSNDRDDRRGGGFGFPWIWYWMMPDLAPRDPYYQRYQRQHRGPQKRFYQSVFDFVFGPKPKLADPKEMEKRLIGFLRDHKGRVTASELSALTGLSLADSDEELTRLMAEYNGEVEVADDGTLIYVFEDLMLTAGQSTSWSWDFERVEPAEPLTGNTSTANAVAGGFAGFNLLASLTVGPAFLERASMRGLEWAASPLALFFVIWFPLMFSFIFFAIPTARWIRSKQKEKRRAQRQLRRRIFAEIWKGAAIGERSEALRGGGAAEDARGIDPTRYTGDARKMLETLLSELDGDVDTDANGRVLYRFPRLAEEQRAVEKAREEAHPPKLGQVIFSSDDAKLH